MLPAVKQTDFLATARSSGDSPHGYAAVNDKIWTWLVGFVGVPIGSGPTVEYAE